MKVQLYENQLERTDVAGARPVTAQVNPNLFARLAGSSGSLGEALVKFGADKMRYDAESKKIQARTMADRAMVDFSDELQELTLHAEVNLSPDEGMEAVPVGIEVLLAKHKDTLADYPAAAELFVIAAGKAGVKAKHSYLQKMVPKRLAALHSSIQNEVNRAVTSAVDIGDDDELRANAAKEAFVLLHTALGNASFGQEKFNEEYRNTIYNLAYGSIANRLDSIDDAFLALNLAEQVENGEKIDDVIFTEYVQQLTSEERQKLISAVKDKANRVQNLLNAQTKQTETNYTNSVLQLQRNFANANTAEEMQAAFDSLEKISGFKSREEKAKMWRMIEDAYAPGGMAGHPEEDDGQSVAEARELLDNGTLTPDILYDNFFNKLTKETYNYFYTTLHTRVNEQKRKTINILKNFLGGEEFMYDTFFGNNQSTILQGLGNFFKMNRHKYLTEFVDFLSDKDPSTPETIEKPSSVEIREELERLKQVIKEDLQVLYKNDLIGEVESLNKRFGSTTGLAATVLSEMKISNETPFKDATKALGLLNEKYNSTSDGNDRDSLIRPMKTLRDFISGADHYKAYGVEVQ